MLRLPSLGELDQELRFRVYLCTSPTDMRKGFDTLAVLVRETLSCEVRRALAIFSDNSDMGV